MTRAERISGSADRVKLPRDPLKLLVQPGRVENRSIVRLQQVIGNAAFSRLLFQLHAQRGIGDDEMPEEPAEAEPEAEPAEAEAEGGEEPEEEEEERLVAAAQRAVALEHKEEEPARGFQRDGAGELHQPPDAGVVAPVFPDISAIRAAGPVVTAIEADWTASESDYKERAAWVMWESGSFSVTGKATGAWDRCTPTPKPADTATRFHVGHYHIHPTLPPAHQPNTASFPIGPSGPDTNFANSNSSPGFVKDFNTTARKKGDTRYYNYGPAQRT